MKTVIDRTLHLNDAFYDWVLSGKKQSTIRLGEVFCEKEIISLIFDHHEEIPIKIQKIQRDKTFAQLTEEDAQRDGFDTLSVLKEKLRYFYPDIQEDSRVSIIYFSLVD